MEKMELDILLKQSLTPDSQPEEGLKQTILERMEKEDVSEKIRSLETLKKWRKRSMLPKVAAVVLAILVVGTGTVYAAGRKFNQVYVHKYGVSTISEDQYDENFERDEREMEIIEYPGEIISEEMGGPDDKWISKSVSKLKEKNSGTYVGTLTKYMYPDYLMAVNNTKMESIFHTIPGEAYQVSYEEEERDGTTTTRWRGVRMLKSSRGMSEPASGGRSSAQSSPLIRSVGGTPLVSTRSLAPCRIAVRSSRCMSTISPSASSDSPP